MKNNIKNLKDKVECLQLYGPKLLSEFGKKPKVKKYSVVETQGGHKTMQEDAN